MEPTVRAAGEQDVPALSALATRTWSDAFGDTVSPDNRAAELEENRSETYFQNALAEKTILVAEAGGALVGYVQFEDGHIKRLYVETALQGRGVGRKLMEAALRHPRLASARRISLQVWEENSRAVRLYESFGFERAGTTTFTIGSEVIEDLVMVLDRA
jgi:ribosomal protein S18 acetylase RimI-like enzyme